MCIARRLLARAPGIAVLACCVLILCGLQAGTASAASAIPPASAAITSPTTQPGVAYKVVDQCYPATVMCQSDAQCCSRSCSMRWKAEGKKYNNQAKRCE
jgi:hypothetical protein